MMSVFLWRSYATWWLLTAIVSFIQVCVSSEDGVQFFGHDTVLRPAFMSNDGQHSYVDTNVTLTRGTLKAFRLFVHSIADDTELSDVIAQVWRPVHDEEEALRLVWEKKLILEERNHSHVARLRENEEFQVESIDKIGFQCKSDVCPVSMDIVPDGRTYIRQAQSNILGKAFYDFRGPIAAVFSFGVDILPVVVPTTEPDLSEISLSEEELLFGDGQGQSPAPHDWHMQTSGIPIEEVEVSSEEHYDDDLDDEKAFEAPTYTPEQRQEMLGRAVYRGHNLTLADDFWEKEGRKTFIDTSFKLQNGILKAISLFVHDAPLPLEDMEMYLELWTRYGAETTNFKLEWQKKIKLTHGPNRLYEFIFNPRGQVMVTENHRLGFSNMDHACPITFKYAEEGRTLFKTIKRYESPSDVNQVYHFSEIHEPISFSIGAHVAPHQVPLQDQSENEISMPEIRRFGHPLIRRQYVLPNTPIPKVFVDRNVHLTPGYVTKFIAFIGGMPSHELEAPIRFQIWTYNGTAGEGAETHPVYKLKWQQMFTLSSLTISTLGNRQDTFDIHDRVLVDSNDRIGFVSEARTVPIPYDFNNVMGYNTGIDLVDFLSLNRVEDGRTEYPDVRDEVYHFNAHPHPITWSIEVEIQSIIETER